MLSFLSFLYSCRFSAFTQNSWHSFRLSSSISFKIAVSAAASLMGNLGFLSRVVTVLGEVSLVPLHNQSAWNTTILCLSITSYKNACIFSEAQPFGGDFRRRRSEILCEWPVLCWVLLEQQLLGSEGRCSEVILLFLVFFLSFFFFFSSSSCFSFLIHRGFKLSGVPILALITSQSPGSSL